jgi:hypothetical protein
MELWFKLLAGVTAGAAVICNLPTSWWMPAEKATLSYLSQTTLQTLDETKTKFQVHQFTLLILWGLLYID